MVAVAAGAGGCHLCSRQEQQGTAAKKVSARPGAGFGLVVDALHTGRTCLTSSSSSAAMPMLAFASVAPCTGWMQQPVAHRMGLSPSNQPANPNTHLRRRCAPSRRRLILPPSRACRSPLQRRHRSRNLLVAQRMNRQDLAQQPQWASRPMQGMRASRRHYICLHVAHHGCADCVPPQATTQHSVCLMHRLHGSDLEAIGESASASDVHGAAASASIVAENGRSVSDWLPAPPQSDWPPDDSEASWTTQARGLRQHSRQRRRQQPVPAAYLSAAAHQPAAHHPLQSAQQPQSRAPSTAPGRVLTVRRPLMRGYAGSDEPVSAASGPQTSLRRAPSSGAPVSPNWGVAAPQPGHDAGDVPLSDPSGPALDGSQGVVVSDSAPVKSAQNGNQAAAARQPSTVAALRVARTQPPAVDSSNIGRAPTRRRRAAMLRDQHGYATRPF